MKLRHLFIFPAIALLTISTPAFAEDEGGGEEGTGVIAPNPNGGGIQNPEGRNNEPNNFNHRVDESHEGGGELIQFVIVGGAVLLAGALAYRAGKRSRIKKKNKSGEDFKI